MVAGDLSVPSGGPSDCLVQGRLIGWQRAWPPGWPRKVVSRGLTWPWINKVWPPLKVPRPRKKRRPSLESRVEDLLVQGVIEPSVGKVFMNHLFEVPKRDSLETRLVLDLSRLNCYIEPLRFRMTSPSHVRLALFPGAFLASVDLKDAYWHVPINCRFRMFLAFAIGSQVYRFKVLPFGLSLPPRVFTKMMVPVCSRLISLGVNILFYLDDWLIVGDSQEDCARMIDITLSVGKEMGLAFNIPKSHLCPTQSLTWIGLVWDTVSQTVALSVRNRARCWSKVFLAIHSRTLSRRRWESLIGSLNFAAVVVPLGRLRLRRLILEGRRVFNSVDRDRLVRFPQRLRNLLRWWLRASRLDSVTPWISPPPSVTVVTDASDIGRGFQTSEGHQESGLWTEEWRW